MVVDNNFMYLEIHKLVQVKVSCIVWESFYFTEYTFDFTCSIAVLSIDYGAWNF